MVGAVKLAVAGAGKTTWLGKIIDPNKRNLLLTFTNSNVKHLIQSVKESHNKIIPNNTKVMTYTKFVYYWIIKPNEKLYLCKSGSKLKGEGMTIVEPIEFDKSNLGNGYVKAEYPRHFIDKNNYYYVNRLSELFCKQKAVVKKAVREYIGKFIDEIYIDEFQDFSRFDLKLLLDLIKGKNYNVTMVGDYYQSLVTYTGRVKKNESIYKKKDYSEFIQFLKEKDIKVDTETLKDSHRCSPDTCRFIRENLGIPIFSQSKGNNGQVKIIYDKDMALNILNNDNIVKLLYNSGSKGYDKLGNKNKWGYSKGSTLEKTCVILTDDFSKQLLNNKNSLKIKNLHKESIHKLYVALTRSSSDTYLMSSYLYREAISYLID